ncbi:glutathione S-transferase family protein [Aspergillus stella-maris]|uniref:glutathione S-transferase family protein n=1 Tax=Aspergillus stella-maris TaxID=1810926 RepID=UPI003CCCEA62
MRSTANRGARIILHSLERSRSQRILWLLEELKLSYEIKPYKRGANERAAPELKALHPLGKAPIVEIHPPQTQTQNGTGNDNASGKPYMLAESAVIMEHLLEQFHRHSSSTPAQAHQKTQTQTQIQQTQLIPNRWIPGQENQVGSETEAYKRYRYLMHYCEGSFMPLVVTNILMDVVKSAPPFFLRPLVSLVPFIVKREYTTPNLATHLEFLEEQLTSPPKDKEANEQPKSQQQEPYLTGPTFTAADILLSYPLIIVKETGVLEKAKYPALWNYVDRLREMDGYKKAVNVLEEVEGQAYKPF